MKRIVMGRRSWNHVKQAGSALAVVFLLVLVMAPVRVGAVSNSISRTYKVTDKTIAPGMSVSLTGDSGDNGVSVVEKTTPDNAKRFVGIVSKLSDNLVTLASPAADVVVTTSGQIQGLVSDLNGPVAKNSILIASPLAGVLMRAEVNTVDERLYPAIAVALGEATGVTTQQIKDKAGQQQQTSVGMVAIDLSTGINGQTNYGQGRKTLLIVFVQSLTGKAVTEWQALGALTVLLAILVTNGIIIYGTIHSAIVAMGRNPLARKSVISQVMQVVALALGLFIFGAGAIFLILWF